jgi:predicted kinase
MPRPGTLILVCGLPGAGKTTLAKRIEVERNAIRVCPDEWIAQLLANPKDVVERDRLRDPVENLQWDLTRTYLTQGFTVVLENGFWSEEERSLYAMGALDLGARIELIYLEASLDELWRRVDARNATAEGEIFPMTREEVENAWRLFEPPRPDELAFYDEASVIRQA